MSGKEEPAFSQSRFANSHRQHPFKTTLFSYFHALKSHPTIFLSITALTILPLSLLTFSSISAIHPLIAQISSKLYLAHVAPTPVEGRHAIQEARSDALLLVRHKALFFLPSYAFSLLAAIASVNSTALFLCNKRPSPQTAVTSIALSWKRLLATSLLSSFLTCAYKNLASAGLSQVGLMRGGGLIVVAVEAVWEMHLMAVLSLGMVVSVLEERFGVEALKVGWTLLEGRRVCGAVLAGLVVLGSGGIGWGFRVLMDEGMGGGSSGILVGKGALIGMYCLVVLFSYVANTALYFECKKFHGFGLMADSDHMDVAEMVEEDSLL